MFKKFSFQQQVLTGFISTLIILFIVAILSYVSMEDQKEDAEWLRHSSEVFQVNELIVSQVTTAESAQRGYALTGIESLGTQYKRSSVLIIPSIEHLRDLVADNPEQVKNVDSLYYYASLKIADMDAIIAAYDSVEGGKERDMREQFLSAKTHMDAVRDFTKRISAIEENLMREREDATANSMRRTVVIVLGGCFVVLGLLLILFRYIKTTFRRQKQIEANVREANAKLNRIGEENSKKHWMLSGSERIEVCMRGMQNVDELAGSVIGELAEYSGAQLGSFYLLQGGSLYLAGAYAYPMKQATYQIGEGMLGQVALSKKGVVISEIKEDQLSVRIGIGDVKLRSIILQPVLFEDELIGVIEIGYSEGVTDLKLEFIQQIVDGIAVAVKSAQSRAQLKALYEQTSYQSEQLEVQTEELMAANEELTAKTQQLQVSEEELRVQQEELRQTNTELEEKAAMLKERNAAVELANEGIRVKAKELEQSSKYKSEFLANMSHELRTPLNSILILAKILSEDKQKTLTSDQVRYASVIHNAGTDLLNLINDILDLSKIESGKLDIQWEEVKTEDLRYDLQQLFNHVAASKKIAFVFDIDPNTPIQFVSDKQRVEQIVKNLLSNAFKFTSEGGQVSVKVSHILKGQDFENEVLRQDESGAIRFDVRDTGIGMSREQQKIVFEAFQQADGSISRKHGGTGLGLSICRELCNLLGGEIRVESELNQGSTFTLYLPVSGNGHQPSPSPAAETSPVESSVEALQFPRAEDITTAHAGQTPRLLIIEDDVSFSEILEDYARERGFVPMVAYSGTNGLSMARGYQPDAIVLDIMLPGMDGWTVLKELKNDKATNWIPVHLMSARDESTLRARQEGAIGFLRKPIDKDQLDEAFDVLLSSSGQLKLKRVLLVEDVQVQSDALTAVLVDKGIEVKQAYNGQQAIDILESDGEFDCLILDLHLPDMSGVELLEKIKTDERLAEVPVVINTAMELDEKTMGIIMKHTNAMVLKSAKSNDRILDEVNLFMHKIRTKGNSAVTANFAGDLLKDNSTLEKALSGKCVLVADDDMRNVFALSTAIQSYDMRVEIASNGVEVLRKLDEMPDIDIVLMDIMMPQMDGYEAMREIRKQRQYQSLPIIALTAKAMKNDREKCLEAGANDYISKPVEVDKLLSMMRVWLS
ncbi:signal transduction histidine kinase [Arcticibacter pallidicorallinus]|uniref:histidine kinase n=1 Tax=Arcticibacter pallidicorallinus TaxID=1259464 RepID=A0A2T0TYU9_9SPHI|nr:response regulator [Arcticibacter pallidicorallinus]PRY50867.1 signal transduction histidine kinase [Arcticibacter pallidicorallinus]